MGAVRQWFGRITPCTAVVGGCRAEQHRAFEYRHFAVGFCGAGQHHFVRVDNRVACDDGCRRGRRVDGHAQRARGHAGIAGSIGCRGGQAVAAIRQDRRGVAPGPCSARQRAAQQRRTVIDLDRAASLRRAGKVSALSLVMPSPTTPLSVENEVMVGAVGAVVSMVTFSALEATPVLPAASVAVAVRLWPPFGRTAVV